MIELDDLVEEHGVVGAQLAVLTGGEIAEAAAGVLNADTRAPVTVDSLFQIASITKVWTATLVQELVNEGRLHLDRPVRDVLPGFRPVITPRQLLTHTSGIDGDLFHDTGSGDDAVERFVARLADAPQISPPGALWSYCNSGYTVLGRVVEVLRGKPFNAVLQERIAAPLGLDVATTCAEGAARHAAVGHVDGRPVAEPGPESGWPAGSALAMSARDLLAFARMHLATPGFAVMRRPQVSLPDFGHRGSWGLGWELFDYSGDPVVGHNGGNRGLSAYLRVAPERGVAVALVASGGRAQAAFDVVKDFFSELAGVRRPEPPVPPAVPEPVDVGRFAGTYRCAGHEVVVTQAKRGGVLVRLDGDEREFVALRDDALIAVEEPHTVLVLVDGRWLHFGRAAVRV